MVVRPDTVNNRVPIMPEISLERFLSFASAHPHLIIGPVLHIPVTKEVPWMVQPQSASPPSAPIQTAPDIPFQLPPGPSSNMMCGGSVDASESKLLAGQGDGGER